MTDTPMTQDDDDNRHLKALSINNPWGWSIAAGLKDIENRDWHTKFRGEFLIHVGLKIDKSAYEFIRRTSDRDPSPECLITGGIIGKAEIVDCVTESDSPWFFGRYGFVIRNARLLDFRPCKGALGFFTPDYTSVYAKDKPKPVKPKKMIKVSPQYDLIKTPNDPR